MDTYKRKDFPYSHYDSDGNDRLADGCPRWPSTIEMLKTLIADPTQSVADKDRAAGLLKWYAEQEKAAEGQSPLDQTVVKMLAESDVTACWEWPDSFAVTHVVGVDGIAREQFTVLAWEKPAPAPALKPVPAPPAPPAQNFELAVPLPVLPVSDAEKQAIAGLCRSFDARFSPKAVAERVAKIEAEARELRAKQ